jgi:hypothetical protein
MANPPEKPGDKKPELSAVDLESRVSVPEAARIKGISPDTFERTYPHLIEKLSERRRGVKLKNVI